MIRTSLFRANAVRSCKTHLDEGATGHPGAVAVGPTTLASRVRVSEQARRTEEKTGTRSSKAHESKRTVAAVE